eukprot:TRINITY_DN107687_c0_g1_i1.p1 TRINITY_DN107687_c0_g1~~TRINITY_DN107687_c0_g1_i1.p1  ORF type:complete len:190 (+),score=38.80 TRINITY_DN107687_c0_g1_i1:107-676(+)
MVEAKPFMESDLLMWKQPAKTGGLLAALNMSFLMIRYFDLSLTPLLCNLATLAICFGAAVQLAAPQVAEHSLELMSKDTIAAAVESVAKVVNAATIFVRDLVLWTNKQSTIQAFFGLQVVRHFAPYISMSFLVWLCGNLLFTVPYLLRARKDDIDKHVQPKLIKAKSFLQDDILAKIPKHVEGESAKEQ